MTQYYERIGKYIIGTKKNPKNDLYSFCERHLPKVEKSTVTFSEYYIKLKTVLLTLEKLEKRIQFYQELDSVDKKIFPNGIPSDRWIAVASAKDTQHNLKEAIAKRTRTIGRLEILTQTLGEETPFLEIPIPNSEMKIIL